MIPRATAAPALPVAGWGKKPPPGTGGINEPGHQHCGKDAEADNMFPVLFTNLHHRWHKGYSRYHTSVVFQTHVSGTIVQRGISQGVK